MHNGNCHDAAAIGTRAPGTRNAPTAVRQRVPGEGRSASQVALASVRGELLDQAPIESVEGEPVDDAVVDAVIRDLEQRKRLGMIRYGKALRLGVHDGRDPLQEAIEEGEDWLIYLKWAQAERAKDKQRIADLEAMNQQLRDLSEKLCERLAITSAKLGKCAERR